MRVSGSDSYALLFLLFSVYAAAIGCLEISHQGALCWFAGGNPVRAHKPGLSERTFTHLRSPATQGKSQ